MMLTLDHHTNFLYLSALLKGDERKFAKYRPFYDRFVLALADNGVEFDLLPHTRDIWARDYMPVQIRKDKFVRFRYLPDYALKYKKYQNTITDSKLVCAAIGIETCESQIILDGGNVIRGNDFAILTNRVLEHNPEINTRKEIASLFEIQESDVHIIAVQKGDEIGHADGIIRVIDGASLLINNYSSPKDTVYFDTIKKWAKDSFSLQPIPYKPDLKKYISAIGIYSNFLRTGNIIFLPIFNIPEDQIAKDQFAILFPDCRIVPILSTEIAEEGGVLNCISWNICK